MSDLGAQRDGYHFSYNVSICMRVGVFVFRVGDCVLR